jgi:pyruvate formate lyase activating enzyme
MNRPEEAETGQCAVPIAGIQPCSLIDFPGRPAVVVFLQGCNWRCGYCHNKSLLPARGREVYPAQRVIHTLRQRPESVRNLVITGGEPTIHRRLPELLRALRPHCRQIKLDTNGSRPEALQRVLASGLVDRLAMDLKAPPEAYAGVAGVPVDINALKTSIQLIAGSGLPHEFRTTVLPPFAGAAHLAQIKALVPSGSPHRWQRYVPASAEQGHSDYLACAKIAHNGQA